MPLVTPQFDWDHVYTEDDLIFWTLDSLACPFAMAIRERARLVLGNVSEYDFRRLPLDDWDDNSLTRPAVWSFAQGIGYGASVLGSIAYLFTAAETGVIQATHQMDTQQLHYMNAGGNRYEAAIMDTTSWAESRSNLGPLYNAHAAFNWIGLQCWVEWLSFYYIDGSIDYAGWNATQRDAAAATYAAAYFPIEAAIDGGAGTYNPRQAWLDQNKSNTAASGFPPPLGWKMPNYPGTSGWTRKREREITSLACPGENGQRARFVVAKGLFIPFNGVTYPTGVGQYTTGYNQVPTGDDGNPWVIDPKPLLRGPQIAALPETPEDEYEYSRKVMVYGEDGWTVAEDQNVRADVIELKGKMRPGDLIGPWLLNELRDAINKLTHTCWYSWWDYENGQVGLDSTYASRIRAFGFNAVPFGPRKAKVYGFDVESTSLETGYVWTDWQFLAETNTSQDCTIKGSYPGIEDGPTYRYAIVDWSPGFQYKAGSNPTTCGSFPPAECYGNSSSSSSGTSSSSSGNSSSSSSSGTSSSSSGMSSSSGDPSSSSSGDGGGGPGGSSSSSGGLSSSSGMSSSSSGGTGGGSSSSSGGTWTPEGPTIPTPTTCTSPVKCGAREYSNPLEVYVDIQFGPEFTGMFTNAAEVRNQYINLGSKDAVIAFGFRHTLVLGHGQIKVTKHCQMPAKWVVEWVLDGYSGTVELDEFAGQSKQVVVPATVGSVNGSIAVAVSLLSPCSAYDCSYLLNLPIGGSRTVSDCVIALCFGLAISGESGEFEYDGKCYHYTLTAAGGTGPSVDNPCSLYLVERIPC